MQKTKPNAAASKAKAHDSGKAGKYGKAGGQVSQAKAGNSGKARKPLTAEQRERKNRMDRERRKRIKLAKQAYRTRARLDNSCCRKGCTCGKNAGNVGNAKNGEAGGSPCRGQAGSPVTAVDVAVVIGRHVARQVANAMPGRDVVWMSELQDVEPGVARGEMAFSNGSRAVVTFVDANAVDPLSEFSPLPPQVKGILLHVRIAREVSDLVDAHIGMESEP